MKKVSEPKFSKVDKHNIAITVEKTDEVPLFQIVENRKAYLEKKEQIKIKAEMEAKQIDGVIKNIDKILDEAKKLGITAKAPEKKEVKK